MFSMGTGGLSNGSIVPRRRSIMSYIFVPMLVPCLLGHRILTDGHSHTIREWNQNGKLPSVGHKNMLLSPDGNGKVECCELCMQ